MPEKVPAEVWEALVQSQVRFNREGFEKVWEALVQSQVRFNRVPEKEVPVKVPGGFVQRQVRFNRVPEKVPEKVWRLWSRLRCFQRLAWQHASETFVKKNLAAVGDTTEAYF